MRNAVCTPTALSKTRGRHSTPLVVPLFNHDRKQLCKLQPTYTQYIVIEKHFIEPTKAGGLLFIEAREKYCFTNTAHGSNYLKSFLIDMFFSESFCIILATAISKSSWVTCTLLSRRAYMPASVQTPFTSAPEAPGISSAIFLRFIPRVKFIFRE